MNASRAPSKRKPRKSPAVPLPAPVTTPSAMRSRGDVEKEWRATHPQQAAWIDHHRDSNGFAYSLFYTALAAFGRPTPAQQSALNRITRNIP